MAIHRIGEDGATVFDSEGKPLVRLRPGWVVVEGTIDAAQQSHDRAGKRLGSYADKKIHPPEDKSQ